MAGLLVSTTVVQDFIKDKQNQNIQDRRDKHQRDIYDSSLTHIKTKFDSSTQKLVAIVSNVLGTYGYKLDSQNLVLHKLETTGFGKENPMPVLTITSPYFVRYFIEDSSSPIVNLKVTSADAASSYFNITVSLLYGDGLTLDLGFTEYLFFGQSSLLDYTRRLSKNANHTANYYLQHRKKYPFCYFWITGEYRRVDGTGIFKIDDIYYYDFRERKGGLIDDKNRKHIIKAVKTQE